MCGGAHHAILNSGHVPCGNFTLIDSISVNDNEVFLSPYSYLQYSESSSCMWDRSDVAQVTDVQAQLGTKCPRGRSRFHLSFRGKFLGYLRCGLTHGKWHAASCLTRVLLAASATLYRRSRRFCNALSTDNDLVWRDETTTRTGSGSLTRLLLVGEDSVTDSCMPDRLCVKDYAKRKPAAAIAPEVPFFSVPQIMFPGLHIYLVVRLLLRF